MQVQILTDRTQTIRASVKDVQFELMLTVALVVMVIFLFLRNLAATVIPSVAVPLSLVGTFGVMYLLGYSLNNLTLMALDDLDRLRGGRRHRHDREHRSVPRSKAIPARGGAKGAGQIGFTIVSLTVSLIAVLIPLAVHGRHRWPPVPRVCRDSGGHDSRLGGGFADFDADDVRQAAQAP